MTNSVTIKTLREIATRLASYDMGPIVLQEGSALYGRAYRLTNPTGIAREVTGSFGYLGTTKAEAAQTLWDIERAFNGRTY